MGQGEKHRLCFPSLGLLGIPMNFYGALTPLILLINETLEMDRWRPPPLSPSLTLLFHPRYFLSCSLPASLFSDLCLFLSVEGRHKKPSCGVTGHLLILAVTLSFLWLWSIRTDWERDRIHNGMASKTACVYMRPYFCVLEKQVQICISLASDVSSWCFGV